MSTACFTRTRRLGAVLAGCLAVAAMPGSVAAAKDQEAGAAPGRSDQAPGQNKAPGTPAAPSVSTPAPPTAAQGSSPSASVQGTAGAPDKDDTQGKANAQGKADAQGKAEAVRKSKGAGKSEGAHKGKHRGTKPQHAAPSPKAKHHKPHVPAHRGGKVTICHATGSSTNPYVSITISTNAIAAHRQHQNGRDIIPAPAMGCPKGKPSPGGHQGHPGKPSDKITICHATGSSTNPFVLITISTNAVPAHRQHQNGRDIIPAPAGGCPKANVPPKPAGAQKPPPMPPAGAGGVPPAPGPTVMPTTAPSVVVAPLATAPTPAPVSGPSGAPEAPAAPQVLGVQETGSAPSAAAETPTLARGRLPFTGTELAIALAAAATALLSGIALRRIAGQR